MAPPSRIVRISHEDMMALPIARWQGDVHLVEDARALERAAAAIHAETVVGFDTETRPAFRAGEIHPPALAQVATARAVYLFPLLRLDCSAVLAPLLAEPRIAVAGVALADDLRALRRLFSFEASAVVDLGKVAVRYGIKQSGVRNLAGIFLGVRIPKGPKTSNWAARRLSPKQIAYAATDAWICRELYLKFAALGLVAAQPCQTA
jgi:ribonuclease D